MKNRNNWRLFSFSILVFMLVACSGRGGTESPVETEAVIGAEGRAIVLGDISDDPAEVIDGTQPLADYLAEHLKEYGITSGQVRVVSSASEMAQMMKDGKVDLYFDSTYPATLISDETGSQIILRRWRFGVGEYHSVVFASQESGITKLEELKGHMVAMDTPYSTSGFVLPAVHMIDNGLILAGKKGYSESVATDEVGYVFSYDDENTLQWVLSGLVSAGVTDDYHFDVAFPADTTEKLVLLARTESAPRQVVVARAGLEPDLLEAIKKVLIDIDEDENGKMPLEAFQTTQFDEFPEGIGLATGRMREMMEIVKDIPLP